MATVTTLAAIAIREMTNQSAMSQIAPVPAS